MIDPRGLGDDDDAWLVYGDELQAAGDPRGELIAIQHRLRANPDDAELRKAENKLFARHLDHLLGPLGTQCQPIATEAIAYGVELEWRHGFVRQLRVRKDVPELAAVLRHPSFQLLDTLWLAEPMPGREQHYDREYVPALVEAGPYPSLRELVIGPHIERSPSWAGAGYVYIEVDISAQYLGALGPLWKLMPALDKLAVRGNAVDFGTLTFPVLRTFEHVTSSLGRAQLQAIRRAHWPALERLEVWFGDGEYGGGDCTVADVRELLAQLATSTPALRELAIANCTFVDELCGVIECEVVRRLHALDLSHGNLGKRGVAALAKLLPRLPELRALNVAASALDDAMLGPLRKAAPHLEIAAGRLAGPGRGRYCAVSE